MSTDAKTAKKLPVIVHIEATRTHCGAGCKYLNHPKDRMCGLFGEALWPDGDKTCLRLRACKNAGATR